MNSVEDKVGVPDLTLLELIDEQSLKDNLKLRFNAGKIYSSIGDVVISLNPYKPLDIFSDPYIDAYRGRNLYELPPHIYTIADSAFRNMRDKSQDQCVIITGESGAGKTEASKIIMKYIAAVSSPLDKIKEQLLNSNPCLEALGNAKTTRNDNSSRFGKYMDLQFDYRGYPIGGKVSSYLLEKSRVVSQAQGERSFHIFYQLVSCVDAELRSKLKLEPTIDGYAILKSKSANIDGLDDGKEFEVTRNSMKTIGIAEKDEMSLYEAVASILHLGNIKFVAKENSEGVVIDGETSSSALKNAAELLGISDESLLAILTTRTVKDVRKDAGDMKVELNVERACYTRDALAKSLYGRFFSWFIKKLNFILNYSGKERVSMIGVLDIYGFEVFEKNGFEQFCINYCNEKLQQIFIELTLKSEQEEYAREGLNWTHIDYFNNAIICDLIESKNRGIIALLDEECLRPGDVTDMTFLNKLNQVVIKHEHYDSREKSVKTDRSMESNMFRLKHYAGNVTYSVEGFIDKNTDLLNRDVLYALNASKKAAIAEVFPESPKAGDFKRPDTIGTQFRASIQSLMESLLSKTPHYLRCIKPNLKKSPDVFDDELVSHQCRYLGLLENVRVRRAGYCYKQKFEKFVERYKMLAKSTWPRPKPGADGKLNIAQAVVDIMQSTGVLAAGSEYVIGLSKVFIRDPKTVFALEDKREEHKHLLASKIRATYLAYVFKKKFLKMKECSVKIQATYKMFSARKKFKKSLKSCLILTKLARGFIQRKRFKLMKARQPKKAVPIIQRFWLRHVRKDFLLFGIRDAVVEAGDKWRTVKWPNASPCTKNASVQLKRLYFAVLARNYRKKLSPEQKAILEVKAHASTFCEKKKGYKQSVPEKFIGDYINLTNPPHLKKWNVINKDNEKVEFASHVLKRHRSNNNKTSKRSLVLTSNHVFIMDEGSLKLREKFELTDLLSVVFSPYGDGCCVVHWKNCAKGDLFVEFGSVNRLIEFIGTLSALNKRKTTTRSVLSITMGESHQISVNKKAMRIKFVEDNVAKISVTAEPETIKVVVPRNAA